MRFFIPFLAIAVAVPGSAPAAELVPVPAFRSIQLRGGGEVVVRPGNVQRVTLIDGSTRFTSFRVERGGRLRIDACNTRCPHRYRLRIEIESPRMPDVAISGGGMVRAAGFAPQPQLSAAVHGGGQIDLRAVETGNVSAAVNGGGQILVRARRMLSAAVNGGGEVRYWGNPAVTTAIHGGGTVRPGS